MTANLVITRFTGNGSVHCLTTFDLPFTAWVMATITRLVPVTRSMGPYRDHLSIRSEAEPMILAALSRDGFDLSNRGNWRHALLRSANNATAFKTSNTIKTP